MPPKYLLFLIPTSFMLKCLSQWLNLLQRLYLFQILNLFQPFKLLPKNFKSTQSDREMLILAFQARCAMFPGQLSAGVRRIDFLGQEVCFIGLEHRRGERWEFKTRLPPPKERMIIVGLYIIPISPHRLISCFKLGLNKVFIFYDHLSFWDRRYDL